jgi:hypothetical protein
VRSRPGSRPRSATSTADAVRARMADLERELREAQAARERARQAAREAARDATGEPPVTDTEDSFGKILGDLRDELADRIAEGRRHPAMQRVGELIDEAVARVRR